MSTKTSTSRALVIVKDGQGFLELLEAYREMAEPERKQIEKAAKAYEAGLPDAALDYLWNATLHNLHRKVEAYGIDIFLASFDGKAPEYRKSGDTMQERWGRVDSVDVLVGCERTGLISRKAMKALEFINWLRNHASAAHLSDEEVDEADVQMAVATIHKEVLSRPVPGPAFDFKMVIEPLKTQNLADDEKKCQEIFGKFNTRDASTCLGMLVSLYLEEDPVPRKNAGAIVPIVWPLASENARIGVGQKYFEYYFEINMSPTPQPSDAADRILALLKLVGGQKYIPEHLRVQLLREQSVRLARAKNAYYSWGLEESVASEILELGFDRIPSELFDDLSVPMIGVCCGNQWGRSGAANMLSPLMESFGDQEIRRWLQLLKDNKEIRSELTYTKPRQRALQLIDDLKGMTADKDIHNLALAVEKSISRVS